MQPDTTSSLSVGISVYTQSCVHLQDRNFQDNAEFFQNCFEAGRRFKIMNPDKMRSEYGKLVYLLMDSSDDQVQNLLEFKCVRPLRTVYTLLEECNGLAVLQDPLVEAATAEIVAGMSTQTSCLGLWHLTQFSSLASQRVYERLA